MTAVRAELRPLAARGQRSLRGQTAVGGARSSPPIMPPTPAAPPDALSSSLVVASLASPPHSWSITQMSSSLAPVASFMASSTRRGAAFEDAADPPLAAVLAVFAMAARTL